MLLVNDKIYAILRLLTFLLLFGGVQIDHHFLKLKSLTESNCYSVILQPPIYDSISFLYFCQVWKISLINILLE